MAETDTNVKSVSDWAEQLKTDRWLLCIAATAQGWLPEQEDDAQDYLTEEAYIKAIDEAKAAHAKAKADFGRDKVRTIVHDTLFIGFIVRRMSANEMNAMQSRIESSTSKDAGQVALNNFKGMIQYPETSHLDRLRDIVGAAAINVMPIKWLGSLGSEGERRAKKR